MRLLASILALFYFLNVVGYGLEVHYCLGQISDVNHALLDTYCPCDEIHGDEPTGCCEERSFFVQLEDEHTVSAKMDKTAPASFAVLEVLGFDFKEPAEEGSLNVSLADRAPPLERDLRIEYHSLQFYG